jgi:hypothetical protein
MGIHPGWMLVILGGVLLVGGLVWIFAPGVPLGRLPGDIRIETDHTRIYIPIVTCIVLSVVLSLAMWVFRWFSR